MESIIKRAAQEALWTPVAAQILQVAQSLTRKLDNRIMSQVLDRDWDELNIHNTISLDTAKTLSAAHVSLAQIHPQIQFRPAPKIFLPQDLGLDPGLESTKRQQGSLSTGFEDLNAHLAAGSFCQRWASIS